MEKLNISDGPLPGQPQFQQQNQQQHQQHPQQHHHVHHHHQQPQQPQQQQHDRRSPMHPVAHAPPAPMMMMPPPVPQLPPQMFTTAAQLLDLTDKKLMVVLRDGRKLIGVLRSWDQFANIVLQSTIERIYAVFPDADTRAKTNADPNHAATNKPLPYGLYADIPRGLYIVRGENVTLLGEIDLDKDDDDPPGYEKGEVAVVKRMAAERKAANQIKDQNRLKGLSMLGFEGENTGEIIF